MSLFIKKPTFKVKEGKTPLGLLRPQIEVVIPLGTPYNHVPALLHAVAAKIDILRPKDATWSYAHVKVRAYRWGVVWVNLETGSEDELAAAMKLLTEVADRHAYMIRNFLEGV